MRETIAWGVAACLLATAASGVFGWVQNGILYPAFVEYFPIGREINSLVKAALYVAVIVVAERRPSLLDGRTISAVAVVAISSATCLLFAAVAMRNPVMTVLDIAFFEVGDIWSVIMLGIALCSLPTLRATAIAVGFGTAIADIPSMLVQHIPYEAGMLMIAAMPLVVLALTYRRSSSVLSSVASGMPSADMKLANPQAFLRSDHALYLCILLFNVASGYALTLNEVGNAPAQTDLKWIAVLAVALWLALKRKDGGEDALFTCAVLLTIAGFFFALFSSGTRDSFANSVLWIGTDCFSILMWLVIASIGKRNVFALLPALGAMNLMRTLGVLFGAIAGHTANDFVAGDIRSAELVTGAVLFAFVAFLWIGFRRFSFEETIRGIETPSIPLATAADDSIEARCATIGSERGLTERETEIFAMLARGRNGSFIQEQFVISRNTVKTHVKRIYKKLDVHSQQELIDLVEKTE